MTAQKESKQLYCGLTPEQVKNNEEYYEALVEQLKKRMPHLTEKQIKSELSILN